MTTREEKNRANQKAYYYRQDEGQDHPNAWFVHRRKVYERILETGNMPQRRTIEKYGIEIQGNKVIVPEGLRKPQKEKLTPIRKMVSADEVVEWLKENKETSENTKKKYSTIKQILEKGGLPVNDIMEVVKDVPALVEIIKKNYDTPGTRGDKAKFLLLALQDFPEFKNKIEVEPLKEFVIQQKNEYNKAIETKRKGTDVPDWEQVLVKVKEKYGEVSPENLFFKLFDEVPVRNNFVQHIKFEGNKAILEDDKTQNKYGKQEYTLSPELVALKEAVGEKRPDFDTKFVRKIWEDLGLKIQNGTIWNDLRHAIITWRNSPKNTTDKPKGADLAVLMRHAPGTQLGVYENGGFQEA